MNVAKLPSGHPFTSHAAKLVATTPWATQSRYTTTTPPSAREILQALTHADELLTEVAKTLPYAATDFAKGLAETTPGKWQPNRLVGLFVDRTLLSDANSPPSSSDAIATIAFRTLAETSAHQPEYDLNDPALNLTGRFLYEWAGVQHIQALGRQSPHLRGRRQEADETDLEATMKSRPKKKRSDLRGIKFRTSPRTQSGSQGASHGSWAHIGVR